MLDDDDAVAAIDERLQHGEEAFDVVAVQAGGGLVEQEQRAGVGVGRAGVAAEIADQFQALRFAAAEGVERLAEGEIAEADGVEAGET